MKNILKTIVFSIPVGITFVDVMGYVARVDGESMKPTLNAKSNQTEYVFLNKVSEIPVHFLSLIDSDFTHFFFSTKHDTT